MADRTEPPLELTTPITPTGNGPTDLEIARQEDELAEASGEQTPNSYWDKYAELHRKHDDDTTPPDSPLKMPTTKIADGRLGEIIDQWSAFSDDDRQRHVVHLGGGSLTYSTLESFRNHPRQIDS